MHAVIPLKGFDVAKQRLSPTLSPESRSELTRVTAEHVISTCTRAGFAATVVTTDSSVAKWATERADSVLADPNRGLDAACSFGTAAQPGPWLIVHGDLPLLDVNTVRRARTALEGGRPVIAPSRDGGTNLLGSTTHVEFSYGVGSFHRHLAALDSPPLVLVEIATLMELDTPGDLTAMAPMPGGSWLRRFLS